MAAFYDSVNFVRVNNRQADIKGECKLHISNCDVNFYANLILRKSHFKQDFSNTVNRSPKFMEHE